MRGKATTLSSRNSCPFSKAKRVASYGMDFRLASSPRLPHTMAALGPPQPILVILPSDSLAIVDSFAPSVDKGLLHECSGRLLIFGVCQADPHYEVNHRYARKGTKPTKRRRKIDWRSRPQDLANMDPLVENTKPRRWLALCMVDCARHVASLVPVPAD